MGADLPGSVLVVSEMWRAAAVGPGVRGTPDGGLAMPVTTGVLYLDMSVSLWGLACGGEGRNSSFGPGLTLLYSHMLRAGCQRETSGELAGFLKRARRV